MKYFLLFVALIALALLFDKWLFESVVASGLPDWIKYTILR